MWWWHKRREDDLERELASHLDAEACEQGGDRDAARRALGNVTRIKEEARAAWGWTAVEQFGQDIRYALRTLRHSPAFTATAVLSLALGIGGNTAIFSLFDAVLLRSLPVRDPDSVVVLSQRSGDFQSMMLSNRQRLAFSGSDTLDGICASRPPQSSRIRVLRSGEWQFAGSMLASGNCFSLLGVSAAFGRMLAEADDQPGSSAVVLSYAYWRRQFGSDPHVIGQTIVLEQRPFTIVGVAQQGFFGLEPGSPADMFVPLQSLGGPLLSNPDVYWLRLVGRIREGVSIEQVRADLAVRAGRAAQQSKFKPKAGPARLEVTPAGSGFGDVRNRFSSSLRILMGAVALVLLIACSNLASLLLARASARRQEMDLRTALGAGRGRLLRQLLTESMLLSGLSGILGFGIAALSAPALVRAMSTGATPIVVDFSLDLRTLAFTAFVSVLTGILFGVLPALRATGQRQAIAQHGERVKAGSRRWSAALISSQVALCMVVLLSAVLLLRSLYNLRNVDPGFDKERMLVLQIRANNYKGPNSVRLHQQLYQRFSALPGVERVTTFIDAPLGGASATGNDFSINAVGPGFFEAMKIPVIAGRVFDQQEAAERRPIAVISESAARRLFPERNPLGERVRVFDVDHEVVGVVRDARYRGLRQDAEPMVTNPRSTP